MSENLVNAAAELQKQMKMVKERNENIIKAHNSGLSPEGILEQFDINQETLDSVLKSAKRNGLLKSPVMEEKKPRRGRPPLKPQEETKTLLKETDLKKKPKPDKKPKQDVIDENLEKVSDDAKKAIESFAPEKKETIGESSAKAIGIAQKELTKLGEGLAKMLSHNATELSKSFVPKMDIAKAPEGIRLDGVKGSPFLEPAVEKQTETFKEQVKEMFQETKTEMKKELFEEAVNQKPMILPEPEIKVVGEHNVNDELNKETVSLLKIIEEQEQKIFNLETQLDRFNHLQDLSLLLMKNTLALVDQAEEQRLEGRQ